MPASAVITPPLLHHALGHDQAILTNEEFWKGEVGDEPALSPTRDAAAINLRPAKIATQIAPGALLVDQAGRRLSGRLIVPPNITLIPLRAMRETG